jgi:hypothetical protein
MDKSTVNLKGIDKIPQHKHNGIDSSRIPGSSLIGAPGAAVTSISGTAGGTYTATEQSMLNSQKTAINSIITTLRNLKLIE